MAVVPVPSRMATSSASDNTGVPLDKSFSRGLSSGDQLLIFRGLTAGSFIRGSFFLLITLQHTVSMRTANECKKKNPLPVAMQDLASLTGRGFPLICYGLFLQSVHKFCQLGFLIGRLFPVNDIVLGQFVDHGGNLFQ